MGIEPRHPLPFPIKRLAHRTGLKNGSRNGSSGKRERSAQMVSASTTATDQCLRVNIFAAARHLVVQGASPLMRGEGSIYASSPTTQSRVFFGGRGDRSHCFCIDRVGPQVW